MTSPYSAGRHEAGDPRQLVRWARSYAKSRTISFLVQWTLIVLMISATGVAATATNLAYVAGNTLLVGLSAAFMVLLIVVLMWFSLSQWGGELIDRITRWLYGHEGYVAYGDRSAPLDEATSFRLTALGGGLVAWHLMGALLVSFTWLHLQYLQTWSAIYMVPFLCYTIQVQRLGFWAWIWPLGYGLHALLLAADAPIRFSGDYTLLNLVVPVLGYGLLAILVGHAYSRFALYKLKSLARAGIGPDGEIPEDEDTTAAEDSPDTRGP